MRRIAGILMVIFGMTAMGIFVYGGIQGYYHLAFRLIMSFLSVFVITGGVFCLRRKYWTVCFISSLLFSFSVSFFWVFLNLPIYGLAWLLLPGAIIPLIFVCLRKREWQEVSA
jgi:hypothetical protein